jgi:flagellin-like protein
MNFRYRPKRKAISPVLATVILIAITLIAAIAIAGFVFGLFGTFTSTAQVSANVVTCNHTTGGAGGTLAYCQITLTNTGNSAATPQTCSFTGSNAGGVGTLASTKAGAAYAGGAISPGTPVTAYCIAGVAATAGTQATGAVGLSNGGSALFTSTFQ